MLEAVDHGEEREEKPGLVGTDQEEIARVASLLIHVIF